MTKYNLLHKFIPLPQAMKVPKAESAVDKDWQKLDMMPAWQLEKVKNQKEIILEEKGNTKKVHFLLQLWTFVSSLFSELEPKRQKCTGRAVFRGDIVKDESGTNAVFFL